MKVLMFGWEFPPYISGGLGTACHGLTRGLVEKGVEIAFVLPRVRGEIGRQHVRIVAANRVQVPSMAMTRKHLQGELLKLIEVESSLRPYETVESYREWVERREREIEERWARSGETSVIEMSGDYGRDLLAEVARYAMIGRRLGMVENFDVVHAHDWMTFPAAVEAKKVSGKPLVVHVHATEFDRSGDHVYQAIYDLERYGMHEADRVVAVSHRTRQMIIDRYGVPPEKVSVVHNAVAKEKTLHREQVSRHVPERLVLFLGRITMQKGPDYFVEAASLVLKKVRNVRFVMAGTGDMLIRMIERAAALRITDRFHFTGFLRGSDVDRMFAMSDLYVLPSVSEPFGITPFEAIKHDVPVIISKQAGVGELLPNAIKVDFWDVQKLSDAIVRVLKEREETHSLIERHRAELNEISWERSAEQAMNVYREVIRR